jgi:hypothetical protein
VELQVNIVRDPVIAGRRFDSLAELDRMRNRLPRTGASRSPASPVLVVSSVVWTARPKQKRPSGRCSRYRWLPRSYHRKESRLIAIGGGGMSGGGPAHVCSMRPILDPMIGRVPASTVTAARWLNGVKGS